MADDEITMREFPPPPETGIHERPFPMQRSIRAEFADHRRFIEDEIDHMRQDLARALIRLSPPPTPQSAAQKALHGALVGGKAGALVLAVLGLVEAAVKLWRPELAGPLGSLRALLGG